MRLSEIVHLICFKVFESGMKVYFMGKEYEPYTISEVILGPVGLVYLKLVGHEKMYLAKNFCVADESVKK